MRRFDVSRETVKTLGVKERPSNSQALRSAQPSYALCYSCTHCQVDAREAISVRFWGRYDTCTSLNLNIFEEAVGIAHTLLYFKAIVNQFYNVIPLVWFYGSNCESQFLSTIRTSEYYFNPTRYPCHSIFHTSLTMDGTINEWTLKKSQCVYS